MATNARKSQLRRRLSLCLLVALTAHFTARAADIDPSGYKPWGGDRFFLLAEKSFSSSEPALVRLEAGPHPESLRGYHGVDIVLYRVPDALAFLKAQKDLHRPKVEGRFEGEGLRNIFAYLWDSWYKKSRLVWQRLLSEPARKRAVEVAPELKQAPPHTYKTEFESPPQFHTLPGLTVVDRFRYPLWEAKPIAPPGGLKLEGSSTNFLQPRRGNVFIPLGRRKPGLYLVEAFVGSFRATTLLFVSDTVAVTKISGDQMMVWTVDRAHGTPRPRCQTLLSDGVGQLKSGTTGADGVWVDNAKSPERWLLLGKDPEGGVFVSENFYYDSEIYDAKIYLFTDRPLYHPGDSVFVKALGRQFKSAGYSVPLVPQTARLEAVDATGNLIVTRELRLDPMTGSDTSFPLPPEAPAGGYQLRLEVGPEKAIYSAAFRVARFSKPHFEVEVALDQPVFKTGEAVRGTVHLRYPSGKPVTNAKVQIEARAQKMSMVADEIEYAGSFPLQLVKSREEVSAEGTVAFELPAASEPSRYILRVAAVDEASFRISSTKEILIQAGHAAYRLQAERRLTRPDEEVSYHLTLQPESKAAAGPLTWEALRLESRESFSGPVSGDAFTLRFSQPGSYQIALRDASGTVLGTTQHWVEGAEITAAPGTITLISDKEAYAPGEIATLLLSFSEEVEDALVTLEKDRVEEHGTFAKGGGWLQLERMSPQQWVARIPVKGTYGPNFVTSVAYVKGGRFVFANKGMKVRLPVVEIALRPERPTYHPGDKVRVDVETKVGGRPGPAHVTLSVVDEMIYVLQPEIAPPIEEFFYHRRRNQVRTTASLAFHTFDAARSASGVSPLPGSRYDERPLKLRERPRRDETDTALWIADLLTGPEGKAQFSFVMPDSLTRWRMTARAMTRDGVVGEHRAFVTSTKDAYIKWIGPTEFRVGDHPVVPLVAFNTLATPVTVTFTADGEGLKKSDAIPLVPGSNILQLPLELKQSGSIRIALASGDTTLDSLETRVKVTPVAWRTTHSREVPFENPATQLEVPKEAVSLSLRLTRGEADHYLEAVDDLVSYPYGCVEQTSSRLIPLVLAYEIVKASGASEKVRAELERRIVAERFRLIQLAGPDATFGWWGNMAGDSAFFTAYAYYADWLATRALGIRLPAKHWENLLQVYEKNSQVEPTLRRAFVLWMAHEMGLPVQTLAEGALNQLEMLGDKARAPMSEGTSYVMGGVDEQLDVDIAALLVKRVAEETGTPMSAAFLKMATEAQAHVTLAADHSPLAAAVHLTKGDTTAAEAVLARLSPEEATVDRALSLILVDQAARPLPPKHLVEADFGPEWVRTPGVTGLPQWTFRGALDGKARTIPVRLQANSPPASKLQMTYDSFEREDSKLPVTISRRWYELRSEGEKLHFKARALGEGKKISVRVSALYVDEITITPPAAAEGGKVYRYGLLEVPLPAGAGVEGTTWGMMVEGLGDKGGAAPMEEAKHHPGDRSYSIDIASLDKPLTFRHLVRFSEPGELVMPPVRYFRMYEPAQKAYEGGSSDAVRTVTVEKE